MLGYKTSTFSPVFVHQQWVSNHPVWIWGGTVVVVNRNLSGPVVPVRSLWWSCPHFFPAMGCGFDVHCKSRVRYRCSLVGASILLHCWLISFIASCASCVRKFSRTNTASSTCLASLGVGMEEWAKVGPWHTFMCDWELFNWRIVLPFSCRTMAGLKRNACLCMTDGVVSAVPAGEPISELVHTGIANCCYGDSKVVLVAGSSRLSHLNLPFACQSRYHIFGNHLRWLLTSIVTK